MLPIYKYNPGDKIERIVQVDAGPKGPHKVREEWEVIKQYDHYVLCKNRYGIRECVTNAEIYTNMAAGDIVYTSTGETYRKKKFAHNYF